MWRHRTDTKTLFETRDYHDPDRLAGYLADYAPVYEMSVKKNERNREPLGRLVALTTALSFSLGVPYAEADRDKPLFCIPPKTEISNPDQINKKQWKAIAVNWQKQRETVVGKPTRSERKGRSNKEAQDWTEKTKGDLWLQMKDAGKPDKEGKMKELGKIDTAHDVKIILLGDSAVGKSKLMERYLLDDYIPYQSSTYALTLYRHVCPNPLEPTKELKVDFWDTAGMHRSYYYGAHCCILVFDITRKITYAMPVILVANKIDMDPSRATKSFAFVQKRVEERGGKESDFPLYFVSASDGSNVVTIFQEAIKRAVQFRNDVANGKCDNFIDEVMGFINEEKKNPNGMFAEPKEVTAAI
ncbi:Rab-like protein 2A [Kappamyces sp. JEL0680]|nr:Rab-like protein 2A [Kappamyces sp. JEL0680]